MVDDHSLCTVAVLVFPVFSSFDTKEQAFKAYRTEVVVLVESLRGQVVEGSEKRALMKKPFWPGDKIHREVVEVLADFVTAHHGSDQLTSAAKLQGYLRSELAPVRAL